MSELGGEKIDIVEWSEDPAAFIEEALLPAQVIAVVLDTKDGSSENHATVEVAPDQQSLAIGRGGQNVRLAAKLTNWKIDIISKGVKEEKTVEEVAATDTETPPAQDVEKTEVA